ncbi:MAG: HYR domain-containing protein, partial [Psychroserpens sp.]|uniref:HYR domain-containing protein n=1 Tax=Psychroserpens sp. TaxID=2020870 RepID=UPI0030034FD4
VIGVAPNIQCPSNITVNNDANKCGANVSFAATDTVGIPASAITYSHVSGSEFPVGTTTVTATATNAVGSSECTFTITVNDTEAPTITCPATIAVNTDTGLCTADITLTPPTASDNCYSTNGNALDFDGNEDHVVLPINRSSLGTNWTMSAWIKYEGAANASYQAIFGGASSNFFIGKNSGNTSIGIQDGQYQNTYGANTAFDGAWHQVTVTENGSTINVYLDGGIVSSKTNNNTGTGAIWLGLENQGNPRFAFTGKIDEVSIWSETRTPAEILSNFSSPLVGNESGLVAYYNFEDGTGSSILTDLVAGNNGALTNMDPNTDWVSSPIPSSTVSMVNDFNNTSDASGTYPIGTTIVSWTATDASGNTTTCDQIVTVTDNELPEISCPSNIDVFATSASGSVVNYTAPVGTDNCSATTALVTTGYPSGATFPVGDTIVTYQVTDAASNTANCSFTVTVTGVLPEIVCPADITQNNDANKCGANVSFAATETTAIPASTITYSHVSGSEFPVGTTTVTATATNAVGTDSCTFTITVNDTVAPTITCPADISVSNDLGVCEAMVTIPVPVVSDNCSLSLGTGTAGDPFSTLASSNTATNGTYYFNVNGNTFSSVIEDGWILLASSAKTTSLLELPVSSGITLQSNSILAPSVYADASISSIRINATGNSTTGVPSVLDITTTNAAVLANLNANITLSDGVMGGVNEWSGLGENRANGTCQGPPETLPKRIFHACGNGTGIHWMPIQNFYSVIGNGIWNKNDLNLWIKAESTSNTYVNDYNSTADASDSYPVGTTTVNWTVTDASGNTSTCSQDITVTDTEIPTISCPSNITVFTDPGQSYATVNWTEPIPDDNCSVASLTSSHNSGSLFYLSPSGTTKSTTVTYTAVDDSGNTQTCTFTVTVSDNEQPLINNCPATDIIQSNDIGSCSAVVTWPQITASDNSGLVNLTSSHNSGDTFGIGSTEVIVTATDNSGNTITCSFNVIVNDDEAPDITCPSDSTISCDTDSSVSALGSATATDNCDTSPSIDFSDSTASGSCTGNYIITRTWTATDADGNNSSCDQVITVIDTTAPSLTVPDDVTIQCTADESSASNGEATGSDTCGGVAITESDSVVEACGNTRTITRTWTATDDCGNTTSGDQVITVIDTTAPSLTVPDDVTIQCTADESSASNGEATGSDTCGGVAITESDSVVEACGNTRTITRTWTATDDCGNTTSGDQVITVIDTTAPSLTVPDDVTIQCTADESSASNGEATGSDTCGGVAITESDSVVEACGNTRTITRTWTATDDCGNTTSGDQVITVIDTTAPSLTVPDDVTIQCTADESSASNGEATGSDTCGGVAITESDSVVEACGNTRTITRTWTATDDCGNTTSGDQVITVIDTTAPSLTVPDDVTIQCTADESSASNGEATGSDTCGGVAITESDSVVEACGNTRTITRTWTATDDCGNTTSGDQVITVIDTTAPSLTVPDDVTIQCT